MHAWYAGLLRFIALFRGVIGSAVGAFASRSVGRLPMRCDEPDGQAPTYGFCCVVLCILYAIRITHALGQAHDFGSLV